ncbi:MAG: hypothetical protein WCI72_00820 [archaeon]
MLKHKIISLVFVFVLMFSLVSSVELKVVKVEDLKTGDIIVDKNGNEIVVTNITIKPSESLTISEYIKQKMNLDSLKRVESAASEEFVATGNSGAGSITGNAIVGGTIEKTDLNNFQKIVNKIRAWFSR